MKAREFITEYKVDNKNGLGSVPYNANVDYRGLRVAMKPSVFLSLARPLSAPVSVDYIVKHLQDGGSLGPPFLIIDVPEKWLDGDFTKKTYGKIVGHEGRNRMLAIQKVEGDDPVEVHIFPRGEVRARHLTNEIVERLNQGLWNEAHTEIVLGPLFERINS